MGMAPTEVDRQSLWQFSAAWNGYVAAHAPDKGQITEREAEELFAWIDCPESNPLHGWIPRLRWDGLKVSVL